MLTDREKHMLWMMLGWQCARYCLVNARNDDGCEKGDIHWYISKVIAAVINEQYSFSGGQLLLRGLVDTSIYGMSEIHTYLAHNLTDCLDTVIGLPLNVEGYFDSAEYGEKMFNWICDHFEEMIKLIK